MILTIRDSKGTLVAKLEENGYSENIIKQILYSTKGTWKTVPSGNKWYYIEQDYVFEVMGLRLFIWTGYAINVKI